MKLRKILIFILPFIFVYSCTLKIAEPNWRDDDSGGNDTPVVPDEPINPPETPQIHWGTAGIVTEALGDYVELNDIQVQDDNKVIVVGRACSVSAFGPENCSAVIARYNPDGTLDTSFSDDGDGYDIIHYGYCTTTENGFASVAVLSDGRIAAGGYSRSGGGCKINVTYAMLAVYDSNGVLDPTFSAGGSLGDGVAEENTTALTEAFSVVLGQADGKPVAGLSYGGALNFRIIRYDLNGARDLTFGVGGMVTVAITDGMAHSLYSGYLREDDSMLFIGSVNDDFGIVALNDSGGILNKVAIDIDGLGNSDYAFGAGVQSDGKIIVAGFTTDGVFRRAALTRLDPDTGAVDTSFGINGFVTTSVGNDDFLEVRGSRVVHVDPQNRIIVVGSSSYDGFSQTNGMVIRYNSNGSLDTSFAGDGIFEDDVGGETLTAFRSVTMRGTTIMAAGFTYSGGVRNALSICLDKNGNYY